MKLTQLLSLFVGRSVRILTCAALAGLLLTGTPLNAQQPDTSAVFRKELMDWVFRRGGEERLDTIPLVALLPDTLLARERADAVDAALRFRTDVISDNPRASACSVADLVGRDSAALTRFSPYAKPLLTGSYEPGCVSMLRPSGLEGVWWVVLSARRDGAHHLVLEVHVDRGSIVHKETYRLEGRRTADGLYNLQVIDLRIHRPGYAHAALPGDEHPRRSRA